MQKVHVYLYYKLLLFRNDSEIGNYVKSMFNIISFFNDSSCFFRYRPVQALYIIEVNLGETQIVELQATYSSEQIQGMALGKRIEGIDVQLNAVGSDRLLFDNDADPYQMNNLFGRPEVSDGELLIETVYRFKGQSAPCVILTEVDFESFDEPARRRLFVGFTRASMKLLVVLSERAAQALLARAQ